MLFFIPSMHDQNDAVNYSQSVWQLIAVIPHYVGRIYTCRSSENKKVVNIVSDFSLKNNLSRLP